MKKLAIVLGLAIIGQSLFSGAASAAYLASSDKKISISTGLNLQLPITLGQESFELQEAIHHQLTESTGLEVDHYYYWVEVDGQSVIAIDPAKVMY
ncbi:hypothetical protein [Sporosarcina sp. OR05]|uniref:hypothetical protein n=1 Tax=Sporosarcina sp. OR05 TaxID=2969819 RepID=UPI00352AC120